MRNKRLITLFIILGSITLLTVLSSVIFSVQHITGYCYNSDDSTLISMVEDTSRNGIRKGRSIFLLNEQNVIDNIHSDPDLSEVQIINVERSFPNRVSINFVKIFPYIAYEYDGVVYYASNDLKIIDKGEIADSYDNYIRFIYHEPPSNTEKGEKLFNEGSDAYNAVYYTLDAIQRMDYEVINLLEFIDINRTQVYGITYMKTRTGVYFKILGGTGNMLDKIVAAASHYLINEQHRNSGMITVNPTPDTVAYRASDDYGDALY